MASRIKMARANAKRGDIFGSAEPVLMTVIREDANLRTLREARAAMEEVPTVRSAGGEHRLPGKAALATVPPLLLNALPRLPEGLEYRFMGNDLILRDTKANLIPDFINNAVPTVAKPSSHAIALPCGFVQRPSRHRRMFDHAGLGTVGGGRSAAGTNRQLAGTPPPAAVDLKLPNKKGTVKFAVIGDNGTGEKEQYEVGAEMTKWQTALPFDFVIMLGDNMYGSQNPRDFVKKFEEPYKALLDRDVKFYAALGNHDNQENRFYKPWNMNGERYYTYKKNNVRFFVLDTDYLDRKQRQWIERELQESTTTGRSPTSTIRSTPRRARARIADRPALILEPLFVKYGVNVVFQDTTTSTSGSSRRRASIISSRDRQEAAAGRPAEDRADRRRQRPRAVVHARRGGRGRAPLPDHRAHRPHHRFRDAEAAGKTQAHASANQRQEALTASV